MADDQLKLDIVVDDNGAAKKLADVDAGVNKVVDSAGKATPQVEKLSSGFGSMAGMLGRLTVGVSVAIPVLTFLSAQLRAAAEDARKFADGARDLDSIPQRIQALTSAAADNRVGFEQMIGGLTRLQQAIGSGKLNDEIRALHINLGEFKKADITEQFLQINEAIASIEDPLERASAKARIFKGDAEEMGRLAKQGFRDAVDGANTMKTETIAILDEISRKWDETTNKISSKTKSIIADMLAGAITKGQDAGGIIGLLNGLQGKLFGVDTPNLPGSPLAKPGAALGAGADTDRASRLLTDQRNAQVEANEAKQAIEEANFAMDAYLRKIGQVTSFVPAFMAIHDLEIQLAKQGEIWGESLKTGVEAAVGRINAGLVQSMMQLQIISGLSREADARTNASIQSDIDRMNGVGTGGVTVFGGVDTPWREGFTGSTAELAAAEQGLFTEANRNVSRGFTPRGVVNPRGIKPPVGSVPVGNPGGFSSVVNPAGGGIVQNITNTISANGSVFESVEEFVRRISEGMAERERAQGARPSR